MRLEPWIWRQRDETEEERLALAETLSNTAVLLQSRKVGIETRVDTMVDTVRVSLLLQDTPEWRHHCTDTTHSDLAR